ncbi:hypothetical protein CG709_07900 [Lachnotalea glycerini]|nr:hypothetical protein CG709_07900 [Lachnotalea glycerini]
MTLLEDIGNKENQHRTKNRYWQSQGIEVIRAPLPVGDYILANEKVNDVMNRKAGRGIDIKKMDFVGTYSIAVDTKKDIEEVVGNICGKAHARFRDECILAQNNGIKLYVLVENLDGVTCINNLYEWNNPRLHNYNKIAYMHSIGKWLSRKLPKAKPTSGITLAKSMGTMQHKYGVEFIPRKPHEAGKIVLAPEGADKKQ